MTFRTDKPVQDHPGTARLSQSSTEEMVARLSDQFGYRYLPDRVRDGLCQARDLLTRLEADNARLICKVKDTLPTLLDAISKDDDRVAPDGTPWRERAREFAEVAMKNGSALLKAEAERDALKARVVEVIKPFASFRLEGFDCEVLEVVPSSPENPARRIEPIWASHFRRAAELHASLGKTDEPSASISTTARVK